MTTTTPVRDQAYFQQLRQRTRLAPRDRPLSDYRSPFLADKQAEGTSPGYRRELARTLTRFGQFLDEGLGRPALLADLTVDAVRAFILAEQQRIRWAKHPMMKGQTRPLSAQTVQNEVRMLRVFGAWLEAEEFTTDERGEPCNVLRRLKLPRVEKKQIEPLTPEEEATILKASDARTHAGCRRLALICLFLDTGGRLAEISGLRLEDLHLDEGYVKIRWQTAKNAKERVAPFGKVAERALRRYLTFFRQPATEDAGDFLFLDMDGYPLAADAVQEVVRRVALRTGIKRLHVHLFRHTAATRLAQANVNTLLIQTILGHSSSKVTELYTHLAGVENLKTSRRLSHLDNLGIKVGVERHRFPKLFRH